MEINKFSAVNAYNKIESGYKSVKGGKKAAVSDAKKMDTVEISAAARTSIDYAKAAAGRLAQSDASPDKIASLKAKIADGSYRVSPESVASAILEG